MLSTHRFFEIIYPSLISPREHHCTYQGVRKAKFFLYCQNYFSRVFFPRYICDSQPPNLIITEYTCLNILCYCTVHVLFEIFMTKCTRYPNDKRQRHFPYEKCRQHFPLRSEFILSLLCTPYLFVPSNYYYISVTLVCIT